MGLCLNEDEPEGLQAPGREDEGVEVRQAAPQFVAGQERIKLNPVSEPEFNGLLFQVLS